MRVRESYPSHREIYDWAHEQGLDLEVFSLEILSTYLGTSYDETLRLYLSSVGTFRQAPKFKPTSKDPNEIWSEFLVALHEAVAGAPNWLFDEAMRVWTVKFNRWSQLPKSEQRAISAKYGVTAEMRAFLDADPTPIDLP